MPMQHMKTPDQLDAMQVQYIKNLLKYGSVPCRCNTWRLPNQLDAMQVHYMKISKL